MRILSIFLWLRTSLEISLSRFLQPLWKQMQFIFKLIHQLKVKLQDQQFLLWIATSQNLSLKNLSQIQLFQEDKITLFYWDIPWIKQHNLLPWSLNLKDSTTQVINMTLFSNKINYFCRECYSEHPKGLTKYLPNYSQDLFIFFLEQFLILVVKEIFSTEQNVSSMMFPLPLFKTWLNSKTMISSQSTMKLPKTVT